MGSRSANPSSRVAGFTLIELLIVVAIIAILAAIAIPNMLEAQTRAKVSRVKADHRTIVTALETYRIDNNNYPISVDNAVTNELSVLTTPVSYLTSVPPEPFECLNDAGYPFPSKVYDFVRFRQEFSPSIILHVTGSAKSDVSGYYSLVSTGPNGRQEVNYIIADIPGFLFSDHSYDPTNGTTSDGDVYTFGGGGEGK